MQIISIRNNIFKNRIQKHGALGWRATKRPSKKAKLFHKQYRQSWGSQKAWWVGREPYKAQWADKDISETEKMVSGDVRAWWVGKVNSEIAHTIQEMQMAKRIDGVLRNTINSIIPVNSQGGDHRSSVHCMDSWRSWEGPTGARFTLQQLQGAFCHWPSRERDHWNGVGPTAKESFLATDREQPPPLGLKRSLSRLAKVSAYRKEPALAAAESSP